MRKLFGKIHLWLSIPVGILISVICFSGAILVFENEITKMWNPHLYKVEVPQKGTSVLPPSKLIAHIQAQTDDSLKLGSLQFAGTADEAVMVTFKNTGKKNLSVNPYTGEVNGWTEENAFFQTVRKLHRWLLNPPQQKGASSPGKLIVGISTWVMVVILISGIIIWWPRNRKVLRNRLTISFTKGWRRFWYDSHVSLGFYATLFLLVMALTGLTWSFGWYRSFAYGLFGGAASPTAQTSQATAPQATGGMRSKEEKTANADYTAWDKAFLQVQALYPNYVSLRIEKNKIQVSQGRYMKSTDTVEFNPKSGELTKLISHTEVPRSQQLKSWFYAFHTGSWGGIYTKVLYFLAALIGGILPLSGYYLWLRKKRKPTR